MRAPEGPQEGNTRHLAKLRQTEFGEMPGSAPLEPPGALLGFSRGSKSEPRKHQEGP